MIKKYWIGQSAGTQQAQASYVLVSYTKLSFGFVRCVPIFARKDCNFITESCQSFGRVGANLCTLQLCLSFCWLEEQPIFSFTLEFISPQVDYNVFADLISTFQELRSSHVMVILVIFRFTVYPQVFVGQFRVLFGLLIPQNLANWLPDYVS